jgi:hypothetical protein
MREAPKKLNNIFMFFSFLLLKKILKTALAIPKMLFQIIVIVQECVDTSQMGLNGDLLQKSAHYIVKKL